MKNYNHSLRITTSEVRNYSKSNTAVNVSFDNLREAKKHVENELKLHPRSKKVNTTLRDNKYKVYYIFSRYTEKWEKKPFINY